MSCDTAMEILAGSCHTIHQAYSDKAVGCEEAGAIHALPKMVRIAVHGLLQAVRTVEAALMPTRSCPLSWTTSWLLQTLACWLRSTCAPRCLSMMTTRHPGSPCAYLMQWTCQQPLTAGRQLQLPQQAPAVAPDQAPRLQPPEASSMEAACRAASGRSSSPHESSVGGR